MSDVAALGLPAPPPSSNGGCGQVGHVPPTKRTEALPFVVTELPHDSGSALVAVTTSPCASAHMALRDGCATPAMRSAIVCVVVARVGDVSVHVRVALRDGSWALSAIAATRTTLSSVLAALMTRTGGVTASAAPPSHVSVTSTPAGRSDAAAVCTLSTAVGASEAYSAMYLRVLRFVRKSGESFVK